MPWKAQRGLLSPAAALAPAVGGSTWTPLDLGSDLVAWWDAQDGSSITQSGGNVSQWNDKSGNARHLAQATGANQLAYEATGLDGSRPALSTGGSTTKGLVNASFPMGVSVFSVIAVMELISPANAGTRIMSFTGSSQTADWNNTVSAIMLMLSSDLAGYYNSAQRATQSAPSGAGFWALSEWSGTQHTMGVNGSAGTPVGASPVLDATGTLVVGNGFSMIEGTNIKIGEIVIAKRVLTSQDRTDVAAYMARWGL